MLAYRYVIIFNKLSIADEGRRTRYFPECIICTSSVLTVFELHFTTFLFMSFSFMCVQIHTLQFCSLPIAANPIHSRLLRQGSPQWDYPHRYIFLWHGRTHKLQRLSQDLNCWPSDLLPPNLLITLTHPGSSLLVKQSWSFMM